MPANGGPGCRQGRSVAKLRTAPARADISSRGNKRMQAPGAVDAIGGTASLKAEGSQSLYPNGTAAGTQCRGMQGRARSMVLALMSLEDRAAPGDSCSGKVPRPPCLCRPGCMPDRVRGPSGMLLSPLQTAVDR